MFDGIVNDLRAKFGGNAPVVYGDERAQQWALYDAASESLSVAAAVATGRAWDAMDAEVEAGVDPEVALTRCMSVRAGVDAAERKAREAMLALMGVR